MTDLVAWPDVHDVLMAALSDLSATVVGPRLPASLQGQLPLIRVRRLGGRDDQITDTPRVDVECYAATYPAARDLAGRVRQRLLAFPVWTPAGSIDSTRTEIGPQEIPYDDETIRLIVATYRLDLRR